MKLCCCEKYRKVRENLKARTWEKSLSKVAVKKFRE